MKTLSKRMMPALSVVLASLLLVVLPACTSSEEGSDDGNVDPGAGDWSGGGDIGN